MCSLFFVYVLVFLPREGCDGKNVIKNLSERKGSLTSPGYPGNYPNNVNYTWILNTGHPNATITEKDPCCYTALHRCGRFGPFSQEVKGKLIRITFVSDGLHTAKGFNLKWTVNLPTLTKSVTKKTTKQTTKTQRTTPFKTTPQKTTAYYSTKQALDKNLKKALISMTTRIPIQHKSISKTFFLNSKDKDEPTEFIILTPTNEKMTTIENRATLNTNPKKTLSSMTTKITLQQDSISERLELNSKKKDQRTAVNTKTSTNEHMATVENTAKWETILIKTLPSMSPKRAMQYERKSERLLLHSKKRKQQTKTIIQTSSDENMTGVVNTATLHIYPKKTLSSMTTKIIMQDDSISERIALHSKKKDQQTAVKTQTSTNENMTNVENTATQDANRKETLPSMTPKRTMQYEPISERLLLHLKKKDQQTKVTIQTSTDANMTTVENTGYDCTVSESSNSFTIFPQKFNGYIFLVQITLNGLFLITIALLGIKLKIIIHRRRASPYVCASFIETSLQESEHYYGIRASGPEENVILTTSENSSSDYVEPSPVYIDVI